MIDRGRIGFGTPPTSRFRCAACCMRTEAGTERVSGTARVEPV